MSPRVSMWMAWLLVSFFYSYQYVLRVMPSILMQDLTSKFDLSSEAFGQFSGIYYIGYSLMHLPLGLMLDKIGPKKIIPIFIGLTVLGMTPLLFAKTWIFPVLGRLIIGMGSSAAILGVFKIIQVSFPKNRFSRMLSFSVTLGLVGAIYGGGPVHMIRQNEGFDFLITTLIIIGSILAFLTYFLIPETASQNKSGSVLKEVKEVLSNRGALAMCVLAGLMVGPLEGFADVWGPQFLKSVYGLDGKTAASLPSLMFLGMCFGGPVLSFIAEARQKYVEVVILSAVVMALSFAAMLFMQISPFALSVIFVIVGVCCAYQILAIYQVSTLVKADQTGLATALANMIIMIFGYFFHSVIARVVGLYGTRFDDPQALIAGISTIPLAMVVSIIGFTFFIFKRKTA